MKRILIGLASAVVLILIAALAVPFLLPKDTIKRQIVSQVETATGWRLRLDGPVGLSLLPSFTLSAREVGLSGEAGADGVEFAKVKAIDFGLSLSALVGGTARVTGVTLTEPRILLETDRWGQRSWEPRRSLTELIDASLQAAEPGAPAAQQRPPDPPAGESALPPLPPSDGRPPIPGTEAAQEADVAVLPAQSAGDAGEDLVRLLRRIRLDALTLVDGTLTIADRRSGRSTVLEAIDITLAMPGADAPATLEGSLRWQARDLQVEAEIAEPLALAADRASDIRVRLESEFGEAVVTGSLAARPLSGSLAVEAGGPSLAAALAAFDVPVRNLSGLDDFRLRSGVDVTPEAVSLEDLAATLGDSTLSGRATLDLAAPRPALRADLALDTLDLDRFRDQAPADAPRSEPPPAAVGDVAGSAPAGGQGEAPDRLDLTPLQQFEAEITLAIGRLAGAGVTVRDVALTAGVEQGRLRLDLAEAAAFGGSAGFGLTAAPADTGVALSGTLRADGLDLEQLAAFAGRSEPMAGRLGARLSFAGEAQTAAALAAGLETQGSLTVTDGTMSGLPIDFGRGEGAGRVDDVDVEVDLRGLDQPARARGGLTWQGERFTLTATAEPGGLLAGEAVPVEARLASGRLTLGADGTATADGGFDGRVSVETPNLRGLLAWLGRPLPPGDGLERFAVSGRFASAPDRLAFTETTFTLDGSSGTGTGEIALSGARPKVKATLALSQLVLDPYLGGGGSGGGSDSTRGGGTGGSTPGAGTEGGWSREPIDFDGLSSVDADLDLTAESIRWDDLSVGESRLKVVLAEGRLQADLDPMRLYEGVARGRVELAGGATPRVAASFQLDGLDAHPFLRDLAGFRALHGTSAIAFDVTTAGASQAALAEGLTGTARVQFTDGSIRGINIPQMMRGLTVATLLGWQQGEEQSTDFSRLSASFTIDKGVARNSDLQLVGPLVRVSGGGTTDIGRRQLDWRVEPKVVPTLEGQGRSDQELVGLGVPVIIRGPWDRPQIYPDISGILENPQDAYKQLQTLGGGLIEAVRENPRKALEETVKRITDGEGIDINKVLEGEADDEAILKAIEKGFGIAPGLFGGKKKE